MNQNVAMILCQPIIKVMGRLELFRRLVVETWSRIEELNSARIVNGAYLDAKLDSVSSLGVPEYPEGSEPIYMIL